MKDAFKPITDKLHLVAQPVGRYVSNIRAKGVNVVVATDNMDTFVRWTISSLHLRNLFDDILCSSEVKGLKSDIAEDGRSTFFASDLHDHHLDQSESLLLDDGEGEFGNNIQQSESGAEFISFPTSSYKDMGCSEHQKRVSCPARSSFSKVW